MRPMIYAFGMVSALLVATGCTATTQGIAKREPICSVEGFEDLQAHDPKCGVLLEIEGLAGGLTAREVTMNGQPVPYIIDADMLVDPAWPIDLTGIVARDYEHTVVHFVERYDNADVVNIIASDDCSVDAWYGMPIQERTDCDINDTLVSGRVLSAGEAARVISQPMVDQLEQVARDSMRYTNYVLVLADKP